MARGKYSKTETRILETLRARGRYTTEGNRETNAARKLVERGLAQVAHVHHGMIYSRHGNGRTAYCRPNYYTSITIALASE